MPTPADAPYKVKQHEDRERLRASRRFGVVNRNLLMAEVKLALGRYLDPKQPVGARMAARLALKRFVPALTRREREAVGLRPGTHVR